MADGDLIDQGAAPALSDFYTSWKLIDAATSTDSGFWVDVRGYASLSVDITITVTGTVKIMGSNAAVKPTNSVDGNQIGADVTASGLISVSTPVRWLKVKVTANGGSITANGHAVN